MRIGVFSRSFAPAIGGMESMAKMLAEQMTQAGHQVCVVTDTAGNADFDAGVTSSIYSIVRTSSFFRRIQVFRSCEVVLFMNVTLHGLPEAVLARVPIVLSHHGIYRAAGFRAVALGWVKRQLTRFWPNIAVSEFVANHLPGSCVVIPNAYDAAVFRRLAMPATRDFVFCGRLVSEKGVDVLLNAFSLIVQRIPDASLTVIGDGPELKSLKAFCVLHDLHRNVVFTGFLSGSELALQLNQHMCMVIPSVCHEGFGIVALEGLACCDSVIASSRGGLSQALGDCGLLIEPNVDALSQAMGSIVQAGRAGLALPGQPPDDKRTAHLAKHLPASVAMQYLGVCLLSSKASP